jgi:hypothetical protein
MTDKEFIDSLSEHPEYFGHLYFKHLHESAGNSAFTSCKNEYNKLLEKARNVENVEYDLGMFDLEHEMDELNYRAHYDTNKASDQKLSDADRNWYLKIYKQLEEKLEKLSKKVPSLRESRQKEYDWQKEQFKKACDKLAATFPNHNE